YLGQGSILKYVNGHYAAVLNDPRRELVDSFREAYDAYDEYNTKHSDLMARVDSGMITLDEEMIRNSRHELNTRFMQINERGRRLAESFKQVEFGKLKHNVTEHLLEDVDRQKIAADEALVDLDNRLRSAQETDDH
ncbi:MAG: hypothetical protein UY72_C0040G0001, partial [Candidatus Uhrbacteria bacterium GW2011_GWD2_52_7]